MAVGCDGEQQRVIDLDQHCGVWECMYSQILSKRSLEDKNQDALRGEPEMGKKARPCFGSARCRRWFATSLREGREARSTLKANQEAK